MNTGINIFHKKPQDYPHLMVAQELNLFDSKNAVKHDPTWNYDPAINYRKATKGFYDSADGLEFITTNLTAIQAEIEHVLYRENLLMESIFIKRNTPVGATVSQQRVLDHKGFGKWITQQGNDLPYAQVSQRAPSYSILNGGIAAKWTIPELQSAQFAGVALDTETIQAATDGALRHLESICFFGDADVGMEGIFNTSNIPVTSTPANWSAMTTEQYRKLINDGIGRIINSSKTVFGTTIKSDLALYVPVLIASRLQEPFYQNGSSNPISVWKLLETNNLWTTLTGRPLQLKINPELSGSSPDTTGADRVLLGFPNEERVWNMDISLMPTIATQPQYRGLEILLPLHYKTGGVVSKRTKVQQYFDGIY